MNPTQVGQRFGKKLVYKWRVKACQNLGVEGVPLYPGTRHSSVTHLGQYFTPEEIIDQSGHKTTKSFRRYFTAASESRKNVSSVARRGDNKVINILKTSKNANLSKS